MAIRPDPIAFFDSRFSHAGLLPSPATGHGLVDRVFALIGSTPGHALGEQQ
jgi:hypothetical protein